MQQNSAFARLVVTFFVGLCFCAGLTRAGQDDLPKVLIIGDSISIGYTNDVAELLADKANVVRPMDKDGNIINCGSSAMGLAGIDAWLGDTQWDLIHFNWGLWDVCRRLEKTDPQQAMGEPDRIDGTITAGLDEYEANLRTLVAKLKSTGAKLIWASTTPVPEDEICRCKGDELKYNILAQKIMADNRIQVNDLWRYMLPKADQYRIAPNNVHYTRDGYAYLAGKVAAMIESTLNSTTIELWPAGAPGAKGSELKDNPTISIYLPPAETATGVAVLICPGGGYSHLALDHEGVEVAQWLNTFGVAGAVLDYRHKGKGYYHPAPLDDAQRAMRLIRSNAKKWKIDPEKVGVLGFSAGGHLASTVTTLFDKGYGKAGDEVDKLSSRPDFSVLCYPVISMTGRFGHSGSKKNLLGESPDPEIEKLVSTELQVTKNTPPTFLLHANDDRGVSPENSVAFYTALREAKVPAELHIYAKGSHGFGLGAGRGPIENWPDVCRRWIVAVTSGK